MEEKVPRRLPGGAGVAEHAKHQETTAHTHTNHSTQQTGHVWNPHSAELGGSINGRNKSHRRVYIKRHLPCNWNAGTQK